MSVHGYNDDRLKAGKANRTLKLLKRTLTHEFISTCFKILISGHRSLVF